MIAISSPRQTTDQSAGAQCVPLSLAGLMDLANVYFINLPDNGWVLVDAGPPGSARPIHAAMRHYGRHDPPRAIVLTHAHFDHCGAARQLVAEWQVPVYAHPLEMPYLTGEALLPPLDPTVGGLEANLSRLFPPSGTDLRPHVRPLPADGTVPELPGWRWLHTPGHTPGHISLFHEATRSLIAGDAVTTMNQERPLMALTAAPQVNGPPTYATYDWEAAGKSVIALAALAPDIIAAGHGRPLSGTAAREALRTLAAHFAERAVPAHGRYVAAPARFDDRGMVVTLPPPVPDPFPVVAGVAALALAGVVSAIALARRL